MDKTHETLELLKRVAPIMQNDPRYIFDQPEYYMGKELREFAKAKSKEFRKDRVKREVRVLQVIHFSVDL